MPRVSVVVPTYLRPHFLAGALASVQAQTLTDLEVLVCDNGADPKTEEVVRALADERFHYLPRTENLGMLRSAMLGFSDARSPLVMKLDDDDALLPDALERLVAPFDAHPEVRLSFGGVQLVGEDDQPLVEETAWLDRSSGRGEFREGLLTGGSRVVARGGVQLAGAVMRADLVDWTSVPPEVATAYDFHLALTAVEDDHPLWFTPARVVRYRLHPGADTNTHAAAQCQATVYVLEQAMRSGRHTDSDALERRMAEATLEAGRVLLRQGDTRAARSLLRRSFRIRPGLVRGGLTLAAHLPPPLLSGAVRARTALRPRRSETTA